MELLFLFARNLFLGFLSLTFQTLFFLNTNLSTFHPGQLVSITVTSLFVKPFNSLPSASSPRSAAASSSTSGTTASSLGAVAAATTAVLVSDEARKILGLVCFLGHFLLVLVRVAPMQKSSARRAVMGFGSSRAAEGGFRGGSLGRAWGDWGWAVRRKESRSGWSPVGMPLLERRRSSQFRADFPVWAEQSMVVEERKKVNVDDSGGSDNRNQTKKERKGERGRGSAQCAMRVFSRR